MLNTPHQQKTSRPTSLLLPPTPPSTTSFYTPSFQSLITPTTVSSPIVITPNTMRSIEQSILQTLGEDTEPYMMESQQYSGNFVPPLPSSTSTITLINTWQGGQVSNTDQEEKNETTTPEPEQEEKKKPQQKQQRKKQPARKQPQKKEKPQKPPPTEEEERRRVRRERNKLAAARCRKRRVDHTNKLLQETEGLEAKKRSLQTQITELQSQKEELEFILEAHNCVKKLKTEVSVLTDLQNLPTKHESKLKRPNTLNVGQQERNAVVSTPAPPVPINTPSNGIAVLGFEPLCSDWVVNTPTPLEEKNVPESGKCSLVTPVNPYKKLQDL